MRGVLVSCLCVYFSNAMKDMGKLTCYDQDQVDELYTRVKTINNENSPDDALLAQMGSLAGRLDI